MPPATTIAAKIRTFLTCISIVASVGLSGCGAGGAEAPLVAAPAASTLPSTPDSTPPTVSDTSPENSETGVGLNTTISATFSEAMISSTLNSASFTLRPTAGGAAVSGVVAGNGNTVTFVPLNNLAGSTRYTATLTTAAEDIAGNPLAGSFTWTFTTGTAPDTTPPTVTSISPASTATAVALNSSVSATFSEPMTNSTLNTTSFTLARAVDGATVTGTLSVSGNTATFRPSVNLAASTQYTAVINGGVTDAAGNFLGPNYTWNFTTAAAPDTTPPTVVATSPSNAANGIATNSSVSATFSEPMSNSTLTTASFRLATTTGAAVTGTV